VSPTTLVRDMETVERLPNRPKCRALRRVVPLEDTVPQAWAPGGNLNFEKGLRRDWRN